jgi:hypothetical protein
MQIAARNNQRTSQFFTKNLMKEKTTGKNAHTTRGMSLLCQLNKWLTKPEQECLHQIYP